MKPEYTKRPDGKPLISARHYASDEPIKCPVEVGDVRDLKIGAEIVYIEVIDVLENGKFKGEIVSSFDSQRMNTKVTKPGMSFILKKLMYGPDSLPFQCFK